MTTLDEIAAKYAKGEPPPADADPLDSIAARTLRYYEQHVQPPNQSAGPMTSTPIPSETPMSTMRKVGKGMADPIEGGAQLLYNVLPRSVQDAGDQFNNWLAEKTGLVAKIPERNLSSLITGGHGTGLNALVAQNEAAYQKERAAAGESGIDAWRLAGNVVSPANLIAASQAMRIAPLVKGVAGATTAGNVAAGAVGGMAQGALMPVATGDYWTEKGKQTAIGGVVGGGLPMLGRLMPRNTAAAKELKAAGIDVPVGQAMGGVAKTLEDKATSIPLLGDAINSARSNALGQFNLATLNKALAPIGEKLSKGIKAGHDAVEEAGRKVSDAYNALLPKLNIKQDADYANAMMQLKAMAQNLPDAELNQFNRILANEVDSKFTPAGLMSGETMKQVESELGRLARGYGRSESYGQQQLGDALKQAQANLRAMVERGNPMYAPILQRINTAFAMMQRPERAASYLGAEGGVFTPAQLLSAVKATDPSLRHRAFARGNALMQDWAEMAKGTLASKYPDSGTAGRAMIGGAGLGGLHFVSPEAAMLGGAATAAYLPGGRQVASGLLNLSDKVANVIANRPAYAAPLLAPPAYGLLSQSP